MAFKDSSIKLCKFCGEKGTGILCFGCKTKDKRKAKILEQLKIEKENKVKGHNIPDSLFGFNRKQLLSLYEITN